MQSLTFTQTTSHARGLRAHERPFAAAHVAHQLPWQAVLKQHAYAKRGSKHVASATSVPPPKGLATTTPAESKFDSLGIMNFRYEAEIEAGTLVVTLATQQRLPAVTNLIVDTFAPSFDVAGLFRRFMHSQMTDRVTAFSRAAPAGVLLVALLAPPEPAPVAAPQSQPALQQPGAAAGADGSWAPNNAFMEAMRKAQRDAASQVVGTAQLALQEGTWPTFAQATAGAVYLSGVCTTAQHRRQGIATHMLDAAEQLTRLAGQDNIHIHVGRQNSGANATYQGHNYLEGGADSIWAVLGRWQLMTKCVNEQQ